MHSNPSHKLIALVAVLLAAVLLSFSARRSIVVDDRASVDIDQPNASACRDCHVDQWDDFQDAPHRLALTAGSSAEVRERLLGQRFADGVLTWEYVAHEGGVALRCSGYDRLLPVDWVFGSGTHAQTPVSVWTNPRGETELLEHRVSWYPDTQSLGATLGQNDDGSPPVDAKYGIRAAGLLHPPAAARDCFRCHTTSLQQRPQRTPKISQTGVSCARCHVGSEEHVAYQQEAGAAAPLESWRGLTPRESINRCGECHRRADQFTPDELTIENSRLIRFAPVSLAQSKCFTVSEKTDRRLDCLTCHNPHQAAATDPAHYRKRCLSCHGDGQTACSEEPPESNCLSCHMKKVEVHPHLHFTDHWIR
ncbi:MAG: multiheme c-type cytochrome [Pirellulaceae bacterium]|jgi:hypothetical protein|nr:multiheme c-type cytochrome [Pirellulaceae bacterium]MDP7018887.1 multiheme c-type cytochrome [Pirellulaceae bacterium]